LPAGLALHVRRIAWIRGYELVQASDVLVGAQGRETRLVHRSWNQYGMV
jgi:hypothetical protein